MENKSFDSIGFWKVVGVIVLFQILNFGVFIFIGLQYPDIVSTAALDDALNIVMHAGTLFIVLYALRSHGISIKKMIGEFDLQNSSLLKWLGYSFLFKAFSVLFLAAVGNVLFRLIPPQEIVTWVMTEDLVEANHFSIWLYILSFTLAPVMEEVVFRGFLLNKWGETMGIKKAIIWSSVLFSLLHFQLVLPQLAMGLLYSIIYIKTGKLLIPMLLHSLHNFLIGALQFIPAGEQTDVLTMDVFLGMTDELERILNIGTVLFFASLLLVLYLFIKQFKTLPDETPYHRNTIQE